MTLRTFLFCDLCNPQGIRNVDGRRRDHRPVNGGRRRDDGRAWYEGSVEEAAGQGWTVTAAGEHLCPACRQRLASWPAPGRFSLRLVS